MSWFDVDKEGLAKLVERRGKVFVLHELLQNAWDTSATSVKVTLMAATGRRGIASLIVEDDHPDGFKNLSHAYTLFAESEKKADKKKRGRFNFGEKLALALCESAEIRSTRGTVHFKKNGEREESARGKLPYGSIFFADVRMTLEEMEAALHEVNKVLPPGHVNTVINDQRIPSRQPLVTISTAFLKTEVADEHGYLRSRYEETTVELHRVRQYEKATLYEMGIPVVELGDDPYHVNVMQKIPLTMERDGVPPSYLRDVRTLVLDKMVKNLSREEVSRRWANEAIEEARPEAVKIAMETRFGQAVISDPSDREAENIAKAQGYAVVPGGTFSADAWTNIKRAGALLPAGQVTPSPKPFSPDGRPLKLVPWLEWTDDMKFFGKLVALVAEAAELDKPLVQFTKDVTWGFAAAYSKIGEITVNAGRLGARWFQPVNRRAQVELLIHELGHHFGHHLESSYHDALCRIGASLATLAARREAAAEMLR